MLERELRPQLRVSFLQIPTFCACSESHASFRFLAVALGECTVAKVLEQRKRAL